MLIAQSKEEAMQWLAAQMNLPQDKEKWPVEWMERLLRAADQEAKKFIAHKIQEAMNPNYRGEYR